MTHRKEFKRPDKSTVQVQVRLLADWFGAWHDWEVIVRKRKYRCREFHNCMKSEATPAELQETAMELWEKLRPNFLEAPA